MRYSIRILILCLCLNLFYAWVGKAEPSNASEEEKKLLGESCVKYAEGVVTLGRGFDAYLNLQRAYSYYDQWNLNKNIHDNYFTELDSLQEKFQSLHVQFLPLTESHFGKRKDKNEHEIDFSEEALKQIEDSSFRKKKRENFQDECKLILEQTNELYNKIKLELKVLQQNIREENNVPNWQTTPSFERKSNASIKADGTSDGIIFGFTITPWTWGAVENYIENGVAVLLGSQMELGIYDNYDIGFKLSPVQEAAKFGRKTQIILPCANHTGRMHVDAQWYNQWYKDNPNDISIERRDRSTSPQTWFHTVDFRHPAVKEQHEKYLKNSGEHYKGNSNVLMHTISWEPNFGGRKRKGTHKYITTSDARTVSGKARFREYLQDKFTTIEKLNSVWDSNYLSFDEIQPPIDVIDDDNKSPERDRLLSILKNGGSTPLHYEFHRWFRDSNVEWLAWCYKTLKAADPCHPISLSPYLDLDGPLGDGLDSFQLAEKACDLYGSEWPGDLEEVFHWSISKALGRTVVVTEGQWGYPENFAGPSEKVLRAACIRNTWRAVAWGRTVLGIYQMTGNYINREMLTYDSGNKLLRVSAGTLGAITDKIRANEDVWLNCPIGDAQIVMLKPSASQLCAWPLQAVEDVVRQIHPLLYKNNYHYKFVPEEYFLSGKDKFDNYKVLILPYAINLPDGLNDLVVNWVEKKGGVVIMAGLAGVYTPYGKLDGSLLKTFLGKVDYELLQYPKWNLNIAQVSSNIKQYGYQEGADFGGISICEYGKGKVLISPDASQISRTGIGDSITRQLLDENAPRYAYVSGSELEVIIRKNDKNNIVHLILINPDSERAANSTVYVREKFMSAIDRGIEGGFPVPLNSTNNGNSFNISLQPGDATIIDLHI
jgi:hypothetical protein